MNTKVIEQYLECKEFPVDPQLILMSDTDLIDTIPLNVLLSQFKYCRNHNISGELYEVLRGHLVKILGNSTVKSLEVINFE